MTEPDITIGTLQFAGSSTWVRRVSPPQQMDHLVAPPLIVVHGGPGMSHDYLTDLDRLATLTGKEREVIYYDQMGCGQSDPVSDLSSLTPETFANELNGLVDALGLTSYDILGHSAGGWVSLAFALRHPPGLRRLVLASTCADLPLYQSEIEVLKNSLPHELGSVIDRCEAQGATEGEAYGRAFNEFQSRHVLRMQHVPDNMLASLVVLNQPMYAALLGPEWNMSGTWRQWSVADRLVEITVPTLVTTGRFDEMTPHTVEPMVRALPHAQWEIFEESAHMAMMEEPDRYTKVVGAFLSNSIS